MRNSRRQTAMVQPVDEFGGDGEPVVRAEQSLADRGIPIPPPER